MRADLGFHPRWPKSRREVPTSLTAIEGLFNANFASSNNQYNLPGYITADAGMAVTLPKGTLTFAETNIFGKYGYDFAS